MLYVCPVFSALVTFLYNVWTANCWPAYRPVRTERLWNVSYRTLEVGLGDARKGWGGNFDMKGHTVIGLRVYETMRVTAMRNMKRWKVGFLGARSMGIRNAMSKWLSICYTSVQIIQLRNDTVHAPFEIPA